MARVPRWDWSKLFSVRAEDLVRPTPAFARHWLGLVASMVRPLTILLFAITPVWYWIDSGVYFPERHFLQLDDGQTLEILERRVDENYFTLQYVTDVALNDRAELEHHAQEFLSTYVGPEAVEEGCTWVELIPTEWCEHGLCVWIGRTFVAERTEDDSWNIVETYDTEQ